MKRILLALVAAVAPALASAAVTVKGSDTMVILAQRWAEEYMKKNPGEAGAGHRRRLGLGHRRAHQRHDRHRERPRAR